MVYILGAIALFVLAAFVYSFVARFYVYIIAALAIIACVAIVFWILKRKEKAADELSSPDASTETAVAKPAEEEGSKNYFLFDLVTDNAALCYEYEENICLDQEAFLHIPGNGGKLLSFRQEPDNEHDSSAVAIFLEEAKLGYIYRGKAQDMVNDYLYRGWPVVAYVNRYSIPEQKATYKIGFYKPLSKFESKRVNLIKTRKKTDEYGTREDNLMSCSEGEAVKIDYNVMGEGYIVYDSSYQELGELPKAGVTFVEEGDYQKLIGVIEMLDTDDNGNMKAAVRIYLVK